MCCHLCLWCCSISESGGRKVTWVDGENGRASSRQGGCHFTLGAEARLPALILLEEGPEEDWYKCGYLWERWGSVSESPPSQLQPEAQAGSTLGQVWHSEAEVLPRHSASRNGSAGAVCQGKHKMLHGKTFSAGIKGPFGLKCRLLTRGKKYRKI